MSKPVIDSGIMWNQKLKKIQNVSNFSFINKKKERKIHIHRKHSLPRQHNNNDEILNFKKFKIYIFFISNS